MACIVRGIRHQVILALIVALLFPLVAAAEIVVVVNPESGVESLSKAQVINIFLGHNREFPNGLKARPVDLSTGNNEKARFYRILVNREPDQMAAFWSRFVFAGSTSPPVQAASVQEMLQFIASNRGAIGYMERSATDARVRTVFVLE